MINTSTLLAAIISTATAVSGFSRAADRLCNTMPLTDNKSITTNAGDLPSDPFNRTSRIYSEGDGKNNSTSASSATLTPCQSNPITFSSVPVLCGNDQTYALAEGLPAGGTYSGTGVTAGLFDPGAGTQVITYSYIDPYGCAFSADYTIIVNAPPIVSLPPIPNNCYNNHTYSLPPGSPAGGVFSGIGVTDSHFDPSVGTQTITYTYTDTNGCSDNVSVTISVNTPPAATFDSVTEYCDEEIIFNLTPFVSPPGGTFSGIGIVDLWGEGPIFFNTAAGTQPIAYIYTDSNGCSDTIITTIIVHTPQVVTIDPVPPLCQYGPLVQLTGHPEGGTFSSASGAVSGDFFNPVFLLNIVQYSFMDSNGCVSGVGEIITVYPAPAVSYTATENLICPDGSPVALTGGMPSGGTYSGSGVSSDMFDASVTGMGNVTISYTYIDTNGCSATAMDTISVGCLGLPDNTISTPIYPNPSTGVFFVTSDENFAFEVTDYTGKIVLNGVVVSGQQNTIDLGAFAPGVYLVVSNGKPVARLIKQ